MAKKTNGQPKPPRKPRTKAPTLQPDPRNANKHTDRSYSAVRDSFAAFGPGRGIVADSTGTLIAGEASMKAAQSLNIPIRQVHTNGDELVCIVRSDLKSDDQRRRALSLADNQTAKLSDFEEKSLVDELKAIDEQSRLDAGFDKDELEKLLAVKTSGVGKASEDTPPEPEAVAVTRPGDLWICGPHRALCGDAARREDVDRLIGTEKIDALITDPPYSSGGQFRGDRTQPTATKYVNTDSEATCRTNFGGDTRDQRAFLQWASNWLSDAFQRSKSGAVCVVFTDWRQLPVVTDAVQCGGWVWRNIVTWWKPGCRMQHGRFSSSAEYAVYGSNGVPTAGEQSPQNVLQHQSISGEDKEHIAQKPLSLLVEILGVTVPNSIVYDPFLGSGTTLIAAEQSSRRVFGIEISPAYTDVVVRRWQKLTGQDAVLESTGEAFNKRELALVEKKETL